MKNKLVAFLCTMIMTFGFVGNAFAAEQNNLLGFVNVQYVLQNYPGIKDILTTVNAEKVRLQKDFDAQAPALGDSEKNALSVKLSQEFAKFEQSKMDPVNKSIQKAISKAAKNNGIANVVNSNTMLFGGKDLTEEVVKSL